jgi:hypothetical protein
MRSRFLRARRRGPTEINHILVIGQSNANGGGAVALSTSTPAYSPQPLMFNGGLRPGGVGGNMTSFVPLVESTTGAQSGAETICSGMARQLNVLVPSKQFSFSVAALDSSQYSAIKKGTATYTNSITQVTNARTLAVAAGKTFRVAAICCLHGEQDILFNNTNYAANLIEWQSDYQTDILAITGQGGTIPMFVCQQSHNPCNGSSAPTAQYCYDAWKTQPTKVILLGARYLYGCQTQTASNLHISSYGQRWHGGLYAEAIAARVYNSVDWKPLTPIAGQVTRSGATIVANFNVPQPPIQLKYDWVSKVGANHGFTFTDDSGSPPTVTAVAVTGAAQLTLTLSGTPTGTQGSQKLRYAWGAGTSAGNAGPHYATIRGNVCDTEVRSSLIDGLPLRNWCAIFEEAVTV